MKKNRSAFALIFGAFFCFTVSALCQQLDFALTNIGVGNGPATLVAVDINNDGHPGLVTTDFGFRLGGSFVLGGGTGSTLSVLTNDESGNFSLGQTLTAGFEPASLVAGDINGDGYADLICGNVGSDSLTVFTNNRQGGFVFSKTLAVGGIPSFVAIADLRGDRSMDLICANYSSGTLVVFNNDGEGNFTAGTPIPVGSQPICVAAGDLNGDGKVDLVCANSGSGTLEVLTNNGVGGFSKSATITVSGGSGYVVAMDVDRNGSIDLVSANGVSIETFINDGHGNFTSKFSTPSAGTGVVAAADMNNDGRVDLVGLVNGNGIQGSGIVLTNDGRGKFTLNASIFIGLVGLQNYPNFVVPADFDGDGNMDFAVSCYGSATVTALIQTNTTARPTVIISSPENGSVIGVSDGFIIGPVIESSQPISIVVYYLGTNILTSVTNAPYNAEIAPGKVPAGTYSLQAVAFDDKGQKGWSQEVQIVVKSSQTTPPPTTTPLTFSKTTLAVGNGPSFVLPVDLNGDGVIDLVTPNYGFAPYGCIGDYQGEDGTNLTFWKNNGSGAFTSKTTIQVASFGPGLDPEPEGVTAADFNGDGQIEMISANFYFNTFNFITNNGKGSFGFTTGHGGPDRGPVFITSADMNGDGKPDIISVNHFDTNITVLTNGGGLSFAFSAALPTPSPPVWVAVGDFNGDGIPDLVSANYGNCGDGNTLTVFIGDGHGGFAASAPIVVGSGPVCVVAADVNGDGKIDLISANQVGNSLTVLTNDGHAKFTVKSTIPINTPGCLVATNITGTFYKDLACSWSGDGNNGMVTVLVNDGLGNYSTNAPFTVGALKNTFYPNRIAAADFNRDGKMDLVVANYGANSLTVLTQTTARKAAPTVSITTPVNGSDYLTTEGIVVGTKPSSSAISVELFVDGEAHGATDVAPFSFTIGAGELAAGKHTLQAEAFDALNQSSFSAIVNITVSTPGIAVIDFDAVNTSGGAVGGTPLSSYLAGFGITAVNVTAGTALEAINTNSLTGSVAVSAASAPNIFTQAGNGAPESFTLTFGAALQSFGFTRAGLNPASSSGLVTHPAWTATAFDANGNELSSVSEGLIVSGTAVAAKAFVLTGNEIASVRFDSDSRQTAAFSGVLLDNLVLNQNAVSSELSVALKVTPNNNLVSPASLTLQGVVNDQISGSYTVSFFAGPQLLGVSSASPYEMTVTGVLPGQYNLQARVTDSTGFTAQSAVMPVTVQPGPNSKLINFDTLNAARGPVEGQTLNAYLAGYGAFITGVSGGTAVAVESQQNIGAGKAVLAASVPNVLTQLGSNGPVQFALRFSPLLSQFGFTRPELLANPFVSHPAWQVTALDGAGVVIGQVEEGEIDSSSNVAAQEFSISTTGGPGIATVIFSSQGSGLTTVNAMLLDNLVLTTNKAAFAPAVAITQPVSGAALAAPPALAVSANAYDSTGIIGVSFFVGPKLIGTAIKAPYTILWTNPVARAAAYSLRAVASNALGLSWTSAVVSVTIASPFQITGQPSSQTIAAGGSATFSVAIAGTNGVGYQWAFNGKPIAGATDSTLILPPPLSDANAGSYTVAASVNGASLVSQPGVLTVVDPPVFAAQPVGKTVTPGSAVALHALATSRSGTMTWQWYLNGTPIAGATNRAYMIAVAQPIQSGGYQVVVSSQGASATSVIAPLIVETRFNVSGNDNFANRAGINPLQGPVSSSNLLATIEVGEPAPGGAPGGKSIWFTWHAGFTGTISLTTAGSDFDTLLGVYTGTQLKTLKAVAADDDSGGHHTSLATFNVVAGTDYQIQVEGYQGASGRVVLGTAPGTGYQALSPASGTSIPVITHGPVGRTVTPNASATLTVTASSPSKISYQWYFQGSPIPGATKSALTLAHVQPGMVGLYEVVAANAAGSARSEPADLEIGLTQGTAPIAENKFVDAGQAPTPKLLAQVLHLLSTGGDTRGFSVAQTFSTEGAASEPGQPEPCGQPGGASQWFVYTAPVTGTMRIDTQGSTFNTLVGVYTGSGESFESLEEAGCGYTTNYLTGGQPTVVLEAIKGTQYFILIDGYQGATGLARLRIGLGQPLNFQSLPASQMQVSAGGNETFNVTAIGSTPFSYQWQLNGVNIAGATKAAYTLKGAQSAAEGNYTVVVSNMMGAVTSAPPTSLRVQYAPTLLTGPSNVTVKLGQPAKFVVTALGVNVKTNPFVSQWFYSNSPIARATALTYAIPATRATNQGPYHIVIRNSYGAVTSGVALLTVTGAIQPSTVNTPNINNTPNNREPTPSEKLSAAAGTYVGLFHPNAEGATQKNSGYLTATIAAKGAGAYSGNLLLDGGSYSFTGKFDENGQTQTQINRPGQTPLSATLQLDIDPADGQMTGQIRGENWESQLQAARPEIGPTTQTNATSQYTIILPGAGAGNIATPTNQLIGTLTFKPLSEATAIITTTLNNQESVTRSAPVLTTPVHKVLDSETQAIGPVISGASIPLYAPLYSGQGTFLGWLNLTQTNSPILWLQPNSASSKQIILQK
ncbi:MAG TPA: FG-GAP-like repeat-containing protein [Verrucomicrobiae bacterium]|jgi:hypothetical protein